MEDYFNYTDTTDNYNYYTEMGYYINYTYDNFPINRKCFTAFFCISYLVVIIITFLVGVLGNGLVIWIAGLKMKKTVNTTWYLSLAVSDFMFCVVYPPLYILYLVLWECPDGPYMCNITFYIIGLLILITMLSSVFLLVMISIDLCVSVVFPEWVQTHRAVNKASVVVVLVWVSSVALITRYMFVEEIYPDTFERRYFICGFATPFLIIIFCYSVIILRLRTRRMTSVSSKSLRVMTVLIVVYFICWLPFHVILMLRMNRPHMETGLMVGITLSTVHGFLRPELYVFMGNNVPTTHKWSICHRIENAIGEVGPNTISHESSTHL